MRANFSPSIYTYPYDLQIASIKLASTDYGTSKVKVRSFIFRSEYKLFQLTTDTWDALNRIKEADIEYTWGIKPTGTDTWLTDDLSRSLVQHELYMSNAEWGFLGYKYTVDTLTSPVRDDFSSLTLSIGLKRNSSFYSLTLFVPIMVLTILSPVGLILPVDAGEKIGYQITLLLTMVIYIEYLQERVPVFDSVEQTPHLLTYFIFMIIIICLSLLG